MRLPETKSDEPSAVRSIENGCCSCDCRRCCASSWSRSAKRKFDVMDEEGSGSYRQPLPGAPSVDVLARVEFENECFALRETLSRHQKTVKEMNAELEEERNASSTAANEAMSMILRLQREKAEIQMEARQFKRFAEEKMAHDQQEILALEDVYFKQDQAMQALSFEVQAYKHRLMSYGIVPDTNGGVEFDDNYNRYSNVEGGTPVYDYPAYDYPPLRCSIRDIDINDEFINPNKYADSPCTPGRTTAHEHLQRIEQRIRKMEKTLSSSNLHVLEKGVLIGNSPGWPRHSQMSSADSAGSFLARDFVQDYGNNGKKSDEFPVMDERAHDADFRDDMSDKVYTIDTVYAAPALAVSDDYTSTPRDFEFRGNAVVDEPDICKLYMRLQALEADRESLKQTIISLRTDKAQLDLLKEIAQNLCKGVGESAVVPERRLVKKPSLRESFSFMQVFKWIASFIFWTKKAVRSKYTFGLSSNNAGLLFLLDRSPRTRPWRCLTRMRGRGWK